MINDFGAVVERVRECRRVRRFAMPEAGVVGRDQVKVIGQPREGGIEHSRRGWKAVKQQNCRRVLGAGLSVENRDSIDLDGAIKRRVLHRSSVPVRHAHQFQIVLTPAPGELVQT